MAVSGGADSLALLLLAHAALPERVEAATVDHRLREESAAEAEMVAELCRSIGVPHRTIAVDIGKGNLQDRARDARYRALGEWLDERGLDALATAHQMDDQAETLLMRLNRGSGVGGLAGVRAIGGIPGHGARLIRPLLGWRRAELAELVAAAGIEAIADPSNDDARFDRVRIRRAIEQAEWLDVAGLARSAALLADAEAALEFQIGREWVECVKTVEAEIHYDALRTGLGGVNVVRIGVVQSIFRQLGAEADRGACAKMVESLIAGQSTNVAGIQARARDVSGKRFWVFARENPRRTA